MSLAKLSIFTGLVFDFAACVVGPWHYVASIFLLVFKDAACDKQMPGFGHRF